jgi:HEAT repeat protein
MEKTLQQLLTLIETGTVEQRCAGLLVAGALRLSGPAVNKVICTALADANPIIKEYGLRYCEDSHSNPAVPLVAPLLGDADRDVQERAIRLLSGAGDHAVRALTDRTAEAPRLWQLNAARVLSAVRTRKALAALLDWLRGGNDEFNKSVCDFLTPALREMSAEEQEAFYAELQEFAEKLDIKEERPALVASLRLLGQLGRPRARRWLLRFVGSEVPPPVRSHALVALLQSLRHQDLRKDEQAKLLALLEEAEFTEATRIALEILDTHELPEDARSLLGRLMQSPHNEVQKFALRKMADFGTPATVRTLVEQLGDADQRLREVAARSLRKIPEARNTLVKELLSCGDASKAWSIVELLPSFEGKWRQDTLEALWKKFQSALQKDDRIHGALLHVLKQANPDFAYAQLAGHGARLVKEKKYKDAVAFLTPLKQFPAPKPEHQFPLALAQLKLHAHTVATNRQHPAVLLFSDLYRNSTYPLSESLKKEKTLTPDDLFALGFSLVERAGNERNLGVELLEHVAARFPRNKIGKSAKNKLKLLNH